MDVAAALLTAGCFAALAIREWGPIAAWPARTLAVCAVGPLITGTAPYGLGLACRAVLTRRQRRSRAVHVRSDVGTP